MYRFHAHDGVDRVFLNSPFSRVSTSFFANFFSKQQPREVVRDLLSLELPMVHYLPNTTQLFGAMGLSEYFAISNIFFGLFCQCLANQNKCVILSDRVAHGFPRHSEG